MSEQAGPEDAMSLLFRGRQAASHQAPGDTPDQPAAAPVAQSPTLQRLLHAATARLAGLNGYPGFDTQRLQLSITTSQRETPGEGGTQGAEGLQQAPAAPTDAVGGAEAVEPPASEGRPAEAAERHRLSGTSVDIRQLAIAIEQGLPFVLLLLMLFVYRHAVGLITFGVLTYVLYRLNKVVRAQVALKAQLQREPLLAAGGVALAQLLLVGLVGWQPQTYNQLLLLAPEPLITEFWDVLFAVVVLDAWVRYIAVVAKVLVLLAYRVDTGQQSRRRGHVLTAVEYCSGFYRGLLPVPVWLGYFKAVPSMPAFMQTICMGVYILLKCSNMYERAAAAAVAVRQAWQQSAYGCTPTQEEVVEAGNSCPICQENLRGPIKLQCAHIFCEDCVSEWFERGGNCPMCRAAIRPAIKSHGDGQTTLLPILM